jgi:magnesium-transporting ATPase (P-type)
MTGTPDKDRADTALKMTLAGVIGQVGCLTLAIIAVALFAGLWLDNQFHTRPIFTLVLVLASVPLTLYLMFRIVLSVAPKIQVNTEQLVSSSKTEEEEPEGGEHPGNQNPT